MSFYGAVKISLIFDRFGSQIMLPGFFGTLLRNLGKTKIIDYSKTIIFSNQDSSLFGRNQTTLLFYTYY